MKRLLLAILIAVSAAGCAQRNTYTTRDINEQLIMATLWMQTSAEYRALCYQAFNIARYNLDNYLASAASSKKPAIIVDADETIIDNSAYQAHLIGRDYGYSSKTWNAWMDAAKARAVPGAVEFLHYAQSKGVEVFYITNRKETGYTGTAANLKELGFPYVDETHLMLRTDTGDKEARRKKVREEYDIVLFMGDNLNDFKSEFGDKSVKERFALTDENRDLFGTRFIVLPNPMYGEWEGAVYEYDWGLSAVKKDQRRKENLRSWNHTLGM